MRKSHISLLASQEGCRLDFSRSFLFPNLLLTGVLLFLPFTGRVLCITSVPRSSSSFASSSMALSPAGVQAHPSPNTLATRLVDMCIREACSCGISGKRKSTSGCMPFVIFCNNPALSPTFMSPIQKLKTPAMVMHREIASPAASSRSFVNASDLPVNVPYRIPARIIPAHK